MSDVHDNPAARQYELRLHGQTAVAAYERDGDVLIFTHTGVPPELEGHGVGSRLIAGVFDDLRARGLKLVPQCAFVAAYVERHPETLDLLARPAS